MAAKYWIKLFLIAFIATACNEKTENADRNHSDAKSPSIHVEAKSLDEETEAHVNEILDKYFKLKTALVESDPQKAKAVGQEMSEIIGNFDIEALAENTRTQFENFTVQIKEDAKALANTENIETQREKFADITDRIYAMTKAYAANDNTIYYTYCPMAFDNEGGYWLSEEEAVRNPYFGEKMLKCGSVKETIAKN